MNNDEVICPICNINIDIPNGSSADMVLGSHIDRCSRRSLKRQQKVSVDYDMLKEFFDDSDNDDTVKKRLKKSTKNKYNDTTGKSSSKTTNSSIRKSHKKSKKSTKINDDNDVIEDSDYAIDDNSIDISDDDNIDNNSTNRLSPRNSQKTTYSSQDNILEYDGLMNVKIDHLIDDWEDDIYNNRMEEYFYKLEEEQRQQQQQQQQQSSQLHIQRQELGGNNSLPEELYDINNINHTDDYNDDNNIRRNIGNHHEDKYDNDNSDNNNNNNNNNNRYSESSSSSSSSVSSSTSMFITTSYGTQVYTHIWNKLYPYQKEGCQWMYRLYKEGGGGILADEMGLGKTCQLCVHFGSLAKLLSPTNTTCNTSTISSSSSSSSYSPRYRSSHNNNKNHTTTNTTTTGITLKNRYEASPIFLIVCPATVIHHWLKEMHMWSPEMRTVVLHSISKTGGELCKLGDEKIKTVLRRLQRLSNTPSLTVIVTYEGLRIYKASLCSIEWTAVCLDEGHKIRNHNTDITQVCKLLPCYHRLILSGTPIQNSLLELWSIFDFIYPGRLGSLMMFQTEFCDPIRAGGYAGASAVKIEIATRTASILQRIVKPYLLRRRKDQVLLSDPLPEKTEHIIFCKLTSTQREYYLKIIDSPEVEAILNNRMMPFRAIMALRKVCNHPRMLTNDDQELLLYQDKKYSKSSYRNIEKKTRLASQKHLNLSKTYKRLSKISDIRPKYESPSSSSSSKIDSKRVMTSSSSTTTTTTKVLSPRDSYNNKENKYHNIDFQNNNDDDSDDCMSNVISDLKWEDSGKLMVLKRILPLWKEQGHKVLLFSQTRTMLDILERLFLSMKDICSFQYLRLDGTTAVNKRDSIIQRYNLDPSIFLILLTTKTGGVGISLTAANRVILLDPDWNPQTDLQARERAWRLGQKRSVTIYRLITRGTIEEKIYERQIYKIMLSNRILMNSAQKPIFSKSMLKELFVLTDHSTINPSTNSNNNNNNNNNNTTTTGMRNQFKYDGRSDESEYLPLPSGGYVDMNKQFNDTNVNKNDTKRSTKIKQEVSNEVKYDIGVDDDDDDDDLDLYNIDDPTTALYHNNVEVDDNNDENTSMHIRENKDDFHITATDMFSTSVILPTTESEEGLEDGEIVLDEEDLKQEDDKNEDEDEDVERKKRNKLYQRAPWLVNNIYYKQQSVVDNVEEGGSSNSGSANSTPMNSPRSPPPTNNSSNSSSSAKAMSKHMPNHDMSKNGTSTITSTNNTKGSTPLKFQDTNQKQLSSQVIPGLRHKNKRNNMGKGDNIEHIEDEYIDRIEIKSIHTDQKQTISTTSMSSTTATTTRNNSFDNSNGSTTNNNNNIFSDDKELLTLLFSNEAIDSVYNHDFLENGGVLKPKNGVSSSTMDHYDKLQQVKNKQYIANMASQQVEKAVKSLYSTTKVYIPDHQKSSLFLSPSTSATTTTNTVSEYNYSDRYNSVNDSDNNRSTYSSFQMTTSSPPITHPTTTITTALSHPIDDEIYTDHNIGTHTTLSTEFHRPESIPQSSINILAMIRKRKAQESASVQALYHSDTKDNGDESNNNNNNNNNSMSFKRPQFMNKDSASSMLSDNKTSTNNATANNINRMYTSSSSPREGGISANMHSIDKETEDDTISVKQQIINRIVKLFATYRYQKIQIQVILNHFQDLGDQYAPLFRSCLKEVAVRQDHSSWCLKDS